MFRLMAVVLVAAALATCGHKKASGPAWPEPSKNEGGAEDGGESIEPREASTVTAAIEKSEEPAAKKDDAPAADAPAAKEASEDKPAATPSTSQPTIDDVIMSDEIIIEIED